VICQMSRILFDWDMTLSLSNQIFSMSQDHWMWSKYLTLICKESITQWCNIMSQKNHTAMNTTKLAATCSKWYNCFLKRNLIHQLNWIMFSEFLLSKEDIDQFCTTVIQHGRKVGLWVLTRIHCLISIITVTMFGFVLISITHGEFVYINP